MDTTGALYKLELTEERLKLYVDGLLNSVKVIAGGLMQGNTALVLRDSILILNNLNQELSNLDKLVDETNKAHQEELKKAREGTQNG